MTENKTEAQTNSSVKKGGKSSLRFWLGMVISGAFLYLALRQVDFHEMWLVMLQTRPGYLLAAMLVITLTVLMRAWRWKILLDPIKEVRFGYVLMYLTVGYMMNNVLPLRAGEVGRSVLIARRENMSTSAALASAVIERTFDLLGLVVYLPLLLMLVRLPQQVAFQLQIMAGFGVLMLCGLYVLVFNQALALRLTNWALKVLPPSIAQRISSWTGLFFGGLSAMHSWKRVGAVFLLSALGWGLIIYSMILRFDAFSLNMGFSPALLTVIAVNFAGALPSSPGQVGVVHYAYVFALGFFGVGRETGVAFGIVAHAVSYLWTTLPGLLIVALRGWKEFE